MVGTCPPAPRGPCTVEAEAPAWAQAERPPSALPGAPTSVLSPGARPPLLTSRPLRASFLARAAPHTRHGHGPPRGRAGDRGGGTHGPPTPQPRARSTGAAASGVVSAVTSVQEGGTPQHTQRHPTPLRVLGTPTSVTIHAHRDPSRRTAGVTSPAAPRARINQTPGPARRPWGGRAAGQGLPV